jgi:hypothetical protein
VFEVLANLKSPFTSNLARGRFVPTPTLELTVSTKRLAVPTSRSPSTWRLEVTVLAERVFISTLLTLRTAFLTFKVLSGDSNDI